LEQLLAADAIVYSDGGGRSRAAVRAITGRANVVKFMRGLLRRFPLAPDIQIIEANGLPAAMLAFGEQPELVTIEVRDQRIRAIYGIINPDKLSYLERQLASRT
jgi:RNA polymerase sigma-70 factor (ECF subfamily)